MPDRRGTPVREVPLAQGAGALQEPGRTTEGRGRLLPRRPPARHDGRRDRRMSRRRQRARAAATSRRGLRPHPRETGGGRARPAGSTPRPLAEWRQGSRLVRVRTQGRAYREARASRSDRTPSAGAARASAPASRSGRRTAWKPGLGVHSRGVTRARTHRLLLAASAPVSVLNSSVTDAATARCFSPRRVPRDTAPPLPRLRSREPSAPACRLMLVPPPHQDDAAPRATRDATHDEDPTDEQPRLGSWKYAVGNHGHHQDGKDGSQQLTRDGANGACDDVEPRPAITSPPRLRHARWWLHGTMVPGDGLAGTPDRSPIAAKAGGAELRASAGLDPCERPYPTTGTDAERSAYPESGTASMSPASSTNVPAPPLSPSSISRTPGSANR
jgi:hypothetical protein